MSIKNTVLHDWHVNNNANMAEFGGYDMPLWYSAGVKQEHLAVIQTAGLFDTSHMAVITLEGDGCWELLQHTFTKDLDKCIGPQKKPLAEGRCVYGTFLNAAGHVIDDAIVYRQGEDRFMVVVNAGMGEKISAHLENYNDQSAKIVDYTDKLGKIDIQGVATLEILKNLLQNPDQIFEKFIYFSFKGWFDSDWCKEPVVTKSGIEILLSRTGYTGEFGVEIFVKVEQAQQLWEDILATGAPLNILPCGLAARDSLRTGAVLPLSHQDIGEHLFINNPWPFALPYDDEGKFTKSFLGYKALIEEKYSSFTYPFAGYNPRKIPLIEESFVADENGESIGRILTCTTDMAIDRRDDEIISVAANKTSDDDAFSPKGLSCGFILVQKELSAGDKVFLVNGKRKIEVEIRQDIRPNRTARLSTKQLLEKK